MFMHPTFNSNSDTLITNIYNNAKAHPMYAKYSISLDRASYFNAGAIALVIQKDNMVVNMFLFYPAVDNSGKIGSVAIYGSSLQGHKSAIERSMNLFGLPVEDISWDEGYERFLDVTLKNY